MQRNPEAIPFLLTLAVAAIVAGLAWHRRAVPGGPALFVMMSGEAGWALLRGGGAAHRRPADQAAMVLPEGRGRRRGDPRSDGLRPALHGSRPLAEQPPFAVICTPALAPLSLAWTNDLHHLYWASIGIVAHACSPPALSRSLVSTYGPVFWLHFGYCYILIAIAATLLVDAVARSAGIYRVQASVMLFGVLLPWAVNVVDMTRLFGYIHVDAVAIAFAVTGLAMLPAFYRYRLLDLVPIAWAEVVRGMVDPVVVLDSRGRIVEFNAAAGELVRETAAEVIGLEAASAFRGWPALAERLADVGGLDGLVVRSRRARPRRGTVVRGAGIEARRRRARRPAGSSSSATSPSDGVPRPSTRPVSRPRRATGPSRDSWPSSATSCGPR